MITFGLDIPRESGPKKRTKICIDDYLYDLFIVYNDHDEARARHEIRQLINEIHNPLETKNMSRAICNLMLTKMIRPRVLKEYKLIHSISDHCIDNQKDFFKNSPAFR